MITVVNKRTHSYDIYIGRGSKWGNPFKIGPDGNRQQVIELYEHYLTSTPRLMTSLPELRGMRLGCFCKPLACHGDVLKRHAELKS